MLTRWPHPSRGRVLRHTRVRDGLQPAHRRLSYLLRRGIRWGFSVWAHNASCGVERKVHKFADGTEADSIVVVYRFKKGELTPAQMRELGHKFGGANRRLASGDEVAHVPADGATPSNNLRHARRQFVRATDNPIDPATGRPVPMHKIKNPPGVQVDEYVGIAWGGQARLSNQHYLSTSTNHMLGSKDQAILQQLRADGLAGVRVRKFRLIFED